MRLALALLLLCSPLLFAQDTGLAPLAKDAEALAACVGQRTLIATDDKGQLTAYRSARWSRSKAKGATWELLTVTSQVEQGGRVIRRSSAKSLYAADLSLVRVDGTRALVPLTTCTVKEHESITVMTQDGFPFLITEQDGKEPAVADSKVQYAVGLELMLAPLFAKLKLAPLELTGLSVWSGKQGPCTWRVTKSGVEIAGLRPATLTLADGLLSACKDPFGLLKAADHAAVAAAARRPGVAFQPIGVVAELLSVCIPGRADQTLSLVAFSRLPTASRNEKGKLDYAYDPLGIQIGWLAGMLGGRSKGGAPKPAPAKSYLANLRLVAPAKDAKAAVDYRPNPKGKPALRIHLEMIDGKWRIVRLQGDP